MSFPYRRLYGRYNPDATVLDSACATIVVLPLFCRFPQGCSILGSYKTIFRIPGTRNHACGDLRQRNPCPRNSCTCQLMCDITLLIAEDFESCSAWNEICPLAVVSASAPGYDPMSCHHPSGILASIPGMEADRQSGSGERAVTI